MPTPRDRGQGYQVTGRLAALLLLALTAACGQVPNDANPVWIWREVTGRNDGGRLPPPGLDGPRPNLASVPPRPERPSAAQRAAVSDALAADRAASRVPLAPERDAPPAADVAPGTPPLPVGPPPPPTLAAAPRVPWTEPARPGAAGPVAPALPELPPAPPPPDLLAPGLLAPAPPRL